MDGREKFVAAGYCRVIARQANQSDIGSRSVEV
jgi:hypothetical protein